MTNHPNRSNATFRFIAFSLITQQPVAHAATAAEAVKLATADARDADYIEVLACGENGRKIWTGGVSPVTPVPLYKARALHHTMFRGAGYAEGYNPLPAIALATDA